MDLAVPGGGAAIEANHRERVAWVAAHAADLDEPPSFVIRLGDDQYWLMRPAASFEDLTAQNQRLKQVDQAIRAAVGAERVDASTRAVHAKVASHHNELLRPRPELVRAPAGDRDEVQRLGRPGELQWVVLDEVPPSDDGAYDAAVAAIDAALGDRPIWRAVYWSAFGAGQHIHFLGGPHHVSVEDALRAEVGATAAARLLAAYRAAVRSQIVLPAALVR
jgi:hypothetical protein